MAQEIDLLTSQPRQYSDFSLTFTANPVTGDIVAVTGFESIKRSIKNLLLTNLGEAPFFPQFGSGLQRMLFEPIDAITSAKIQTEITETITAFEPRVTILQLLITPTPDESQYRIDLALQLNNLATPFTITLYLERLR